MHYNSYCIYIAFFTYYPGGVSLRILSNICTPHASRYLQTRFV
ncbi:hypothetical protein T05_5388 [Trichinella murrelli]|uniref:Uncharacterized protein n=1 Tax=Trichinella murrelli TaxID=144512 RepID=A0A0V0SVK1_9BILA|nr:hypothetical protein T05_5388 [Trichinella murrelli]